MNSPRHRDETPTGKSLRASLFERSAPPPRIEQQPRPGASPAFPYGVATAVAPTPAELLLASPAVVRLCESYHKAESRLTARARRQRLGIFLLVCGISVGALFLFNSGTLTAGLVSELVLAAAGASCVSVGLLALMWMRDGRRLRNIQGERLLRALQASCSLPSDRLYAFRRNHEPVAAFFICYATWRAEHGAGAVGGLFKKLRQTRA
jgi:hypothetical protein